MKLLLQRDKTQCETTTGKLDVNGVFECFTLEDAVRVLGPNGEGKIMGETAIPAGTYTVIINLSPRFKKDMMRLVDVPFFTGILIHGGNTKEDTHGCILVGDKLSQGKIVGGTSTPAVKRLFSKVKKAIDGGEHVTITINDAHEAT